jgi:hypothetical protein
VSALAEALVAAQRRALAALEKSYVHSPLTPEELDAEKDRVRAIMDAIGCTDTVEQGQLFASLDVIRATGAALPSEPTNGVPKSPEPMSDAQASYIDKLWQEHGGKPGDKPILTGLTKDMASKLISQLKTNTYNVADWDIPF